MPPVTYAARTGIEEEKRRRERNTWVRVQLACSRCSWVKMMLLLKRACHIVAALLASPPPTVCVYQVRREQRIATPVPNQCTSIEEALLHRLRCQSSRVQTAVVDSGDELD